MPRDFQWKLPGAHLHLKKKEGWMTRIHLDGWLLLALLVLMSSGLLILYSATGSNLDVTLSQGYRLLFALVVMLVIAQIPPRFMQRWALPVYVLGVVSLVAVLFLGIDALLQSHHRRRPLLLQQPLVQYNCANLHHAMDQRQQAGATSLLKSAQHLNPKCYDMIFQKYGCLFHRELFSRCH
jgi:hypothetical protein